MAFAVAFKRQIKFLIPQKSFFLPELLRHLRLQQPASKESFASDPVSQLLFENSDGDIQADWEEAVTLFYRQNVIQTDKWEEAINAI